jgi:hypothetical protein
MNLWGLRERWAAAGGGAGDSDAGFDRKEGAAFCSRERTTTMRDYFGPTGRQFGDAGGSSHWDGVESAGETAAA